MQKELQGVGDRLKSRREELQLSQEEVAKAIGVAQPTYLYYEKGRIQRIGRRNLEKLAAIFKTTPDWILGFENHSLSHLSEEIKAFVHSPKSAPYIKEAYIKYLQEN